MTPTEGSRAFIKLTASPHQPWGKGNAEQHQTFNKRRKVSWLVNERTTKKTPMNNTIP